MRCLPPLLLAIVVVACGAPLIGPEYLSTDLALIHAGMVGVIFGLFGSLPSSESNDPKRQSRESFPPRLEVVLLIVVLTIATLLRLQDLRTLPFGVWFDEAQNMLVAKRIIADPSYRPVFVPDLSQLPALPFYYYAVFIKLFGDDIFSLRLATSIVGIGAVATTWLLARELFGPRVGLLAAALLAVSRWHLTFSRFGMANIFVTFFAPLVLYLFIRSQSQRSLRFGVAGGIALGCGLQTYYSFLMFPALLVGVWIVRLVTRSRTSVVAMGALCATAAAVYTPVAVYAYRNWDAFSERIQTVATVSPRDALALAFDHSDNTRDTRQQLTYSFVRHVRMFHYVGDRNGRHNLPEKPMLDPVSGVLLIIGSVFVLFRLFDWRSILLIGCAILFISAGIFSIPAEAPQAARSLGLTPFLAIVCALPFGAIPLALNRRWFSYMVALGALGIASMSGTLSIATFHEQLRSPSVWAEYSAAQTRIAQITREAHIGTRISAPERLSGGPTIDLIANPAIPIIPFHPSNLIPLPCEYSDFVYTFTPEQYPWLDLAQQIYPEAQRKTLHAPGSGDPLLYELHVSRREIQRTCLTQAAVDEHRHVWIRTRHASNLPNTTLALPAGVVLMSPAEIHTHRDALNLADIYPTTIPLGGLTATEHSIPLPESELPFRENYPLPDWHFHEFHSAVPISITWRGTVKIETAGAYDLLLQVRDKGSLIIDGTPVIRLKRRGVRTTSLVLTAGEHSVEMTMQALTGYFMASWQWRPPNQEAFSVVPSNLLRPLPITSISGMKASEDAQ
jgi:4-amino-4-deoxy-L-arabinose transferase-like glycosyltransferase